ncbi:MAG: OmpA family protein [Phycisphaerae bacterium]|nr:OmpA family protein [Phycisphaerae bacterium]NUQ47847.1 OmpA family protein [Phycisphaerae bacterium]
MSRGRAVKLGVTLCMMFGLAGCGPDKDKQIADLMAERDGLRKDLADRDRLMADANQREDDAQRTILSLRDQLDAARKELDERGSEAEGWIGMPGFDMISIQGEVLFDSGKATLRSGASGTLDRIASDLLGRFGDRDIYVFGHTDTDPIRKSGWKDNWELGAQRALTITRYLVTKGVNPTKISAVSCGEHRARDTNANAAGKQRNRRVEFYAVVPKAGGAAGAARETSP